MSNKIVTSFFRGEDDVTLLDFFNNASNCAETLSGIVK